MPLCHLASRDLFYTEKGTGEPLVFLNGLSGDHLYWAGQLRALARRYRCFALDNRDVGQSSYAAAPYSVADLATDVVGLLDHRGVPAAHVVGLSLGGMIAQELALAAPERVKGLALVSTLARSDDWFRATLRAFGLIRGQVADTAAFFEAILPWWVSHRFFEQGDRVSWLCWLLRQNPHPQRLDGFLRQLDAIGRHDAQGRLQALRCPVLILTGEDDSVAPPRYAHQLHHQIPHARLVLLPGVGHAPPVEDPGAFNARLAEFLAGQDEA
jgi:pimeloyl-ACP methyl ester carboxylesterase